jgi:hypothetical protein
MTVILIKILLWALAISFAICLLEELINKNQNHEN